MSTPAPPPWSALLLSALLALAGCAKDDYVRLYHSEPRAPSISVEELETLQKMGAHLVRADGRYRASTSRVYSRARRAHRAAALRRPRDRRAHPRSSSMTRFGDVWNVYVEGVGLGQHYGFRRLGPELALRRRRGTPGSIDGFRADVDADGNRFNPNKLLFDPYAKALHRDHDWSKGSVATGPRARRVDLRGRRDQERGGRRASYAWSDEEAPAAQRRAGPGHAGPPLERPHPLRGAPQGLHHEPGLGRDAPRAPTAASARRRDYLKELGITAVELLPLHREAARRRLLGLPDAQLLRARAHLRRRRTRAGRRSSTSSSGWWSSSTSTTSR